jgi:hypothetical protein
MNEQCRIRVWRTKKDTYGRLDSPVSKSNFESCEGACELARVVSHFSKFRNGRIDSEHHPETIDQPIPGYH